MKPNNYIDEIREYRVASHDIWNVSSEERLNILKLDWNEATIPPSPKVQERIMKLVKKDNFYNLYPQTYNDELINLLVMYAGVEQNQLQYFASSDSLHEYICKVFVDKGSRVMILSPSYDNFRLTAEANGAEIIYSDLNDRFEFEENTFEQDILNYQPKVIYICNPNNPTGMLLRVDYIERLLKNNRKILFIIDEAYWEFTGVTVKSLIVEYKNLIITRTLSKAFALANFRFGYLISNEENVISINKIRNPKNISTFTQEAAIGALSDIEYMKSYVGEVSKAKRYFYGELLKMQELGQPIWGDGNFLMFKCTNTNVKHELLEFLKKRKIYIRDISQRPSVFNCVRVSIGTMPQMVIVVDAFNSYLKMSKHKL